MVVVPPYQAYLLLPKASSGSDIDHLTPIMATTSRFMSKLAGQIVLLIGATGGIGVGVAQGLLEFGAIVYLSSFREAKSRPLRTVPPQRLSIGERSRFRLPMRPQQPGGGGKPGTAVRQSRQSRPRCVYGR